MRTLWMTLVVVFVCACASAPAPKGLSELAKETPTPRLCFIVAGQDHAVLQGYKSAEEIELEKRGINCDGGLIAQGADQGPLPAKMTLAQSLPLIGHPFLCYLSVHG